MWTLLIRPDKEQISAQHTVSPVLKTEPATEPEMLHVMRDIRIYPQDRRHMPWDIDVKKQHVLPDILRLCAQENASNRSVIPTAIWGKTNV